MSRPQPGPAVSVLEPFSGGPAHAPFNAGLLEALAAALPEPAIPFFCARGHLTRVTELLPESVRSRLAVRCWKDGDRPPSFGGQVGRDLSMLRKTMSSVAGTARPATCLVTDTLPSTIWAARILLGLGRIDEVRMVVHGNAVDLTGWRARNPLVRMQQLRSAMLSCRHPGLRYIVLEEAIAHEVRRLLPELAGRIDVVPHPLLSAELTPPVPPPAAPPLRIGFLGAATAKKGFDDFIAVASAVVPRVHGRVAFCAYGWRPDTEPELDLGLLETKPSPAPLARGEFRSGLERVHYVCMPFAPDQYRLSASGTLMDALTAARPIVALRTPTLTDLFAEVGPFGYLCDDREEMVAVLLRLASGPFDAAAYARHVETAERARWARSPARLAPRLRRVLAPGGAGGQTDPCAEGRSGA